MKNFNIIVFTGTPQVNISKPSKYGIIWCDYTTPIYIIILYFHYIMVTGTTTPTIQQVDFYEFTL